MKVKEYMISVYAVLVKNSKRDIESLPEEYIIPVAEYLAAPGGRHSRAGGVTPQGHPPKGRRGPQNGP